MYKEQIIEHVPKAFKADGALVKKAIYGAIKNAERFDTSLVIKGKNGRIRNVSAAQMRRMVSKKK